MEEFVKMGLPWEAIMESLVAEGKLLLKEYGKIKAGERYHGVPWSSMEFHGASSKNSSKANVLIFITLPPSFGKFQFHLWSI